MNTLSQTTIEKLGYYVYLLIDPREGAENNGEEKGSGTFFENRNFLNSIIA